MHQRRCKLQHYHDFVLSHCTLLLNVWLAFISCCMLLTLWSGQWSPYTCCVPKQKIEGKGLAVESWKTRKLSCYTLLCYRMNSKHLHGFDVVCGS